MPLTFPDNPQIGQTIGYSFTHPTLGGQSGDVVTRLWTWNGPTMGWVSNGTRQLDYITRTEAIDIFVNESGDIMTGTLTGTDASFNSITASNGFIGTLTGNYIDIPSLGDFGSQIRVASNNLLGMPYYSNSMHSLDLWSRLHLIGGNGATGYALRITTSSSGETVADSKGKTIFDQGSTYGVAVTPYGLFDPNDGSAGLSFFATNLYTGENNREDASMDYDGLTTDDYSGMLTLETDGKGYIPRMFSTRKSSLLDTFQDNEYITKQYAEDNFGSGEMVIMTDDPATSTDPKIFRTLRIFKMRKSDGSLITYQLDDTYLYFNNEFNGSWGRYYEADPKVILLQNTQQLPNFGWASLKQSLDGDPLLSSVSFRRQGEYQIAGPGTYYYYSGDIGTFLTVPNDSVYYFLSATRPASPYLQQYLANSAAHIQIMTYSN